MPSRFAPKAAATLYFCVCILSAAALSACGGATSNNLASATGSDPINGVHDADTGDRIRTACALAAVACRNRTNGVPTPDTPTPDAPPTTPPSEPDPTVGPIPDPAPSPSPDPVPAPPPAPAGPGTATIFWDAPSTQADGTAIGALTGYRIYYGKASGSYSASLFVPGTSGSSGTVNGLDGGTWYFSVSAVDASGNESQLGYEMSKAL